MHVNFFGKNIPWHEGFFSEIMNKLPQKNVIKNKIWLFFSPISYSDRLDSEFCKFGYLSSLVMPDEVRVIFFPHTHDSLRKIFLKIHAQQNWSLCKLDFQMNLLESVKMSKQKKNFSHRILPFLDSLIV